MLSVPPHPSHPFLNGELTEDELNPERALFHVIPAPLELTVSYGSGARRGPQAILDLSATCHMPDVIEAPYRPALLGERPEGEGVEVLLGGPSCLAGDVIGSYWLPERPVVGQRVAFLDQAHYSMVKTNTFNGVPLPSIALWDSELGSLEIVKTFEWTEFERRLS